MRLALYGMNGCNLTEKSLAVKCGQEEFPVYETGFAVKNGGAGRVWGRMMPLFFACSAAFLYVAGLQTSGGLRHRPDYSVKVTLRVRLWPAVCSCCSATLSCVPSRDGRFRASRPPGFPGNALPQFHASAAVSPG